MPGRVSYCDAVSTRPAIVSPPATRRATPFASRSGSRFAALLAAGLLVIAACGGPAVPARSPSQRAEDSAPAVAALHASKFEEAGAAAAAVLARDPRNARAAAVRALVTYLAAGFQLRDDLDRVFDGADGLTKLDQAEGHAMWQHFADQLAVVDRDLAIVAADPSFSLELCLACWERDWNHSGDVDDRDRRLFEIEYDGLAKAGPDGALMPFVPEGDPRRRPTFKFDVGDAEWARAMVAFQRSAMELLMAYRWSELSRIGALFFGKDEGGPMIELVLAEPARVKRARELIVSGLGYADRCRAAYLAETDDDREWVPNPKQQSHPIPLAVDDSLYQTWEGVAGDLQRLLASKEGLSLRALAALGDRDSSQYFPDAYLDLGAMLGEPSSIKINIALMNKLDAVMREHGAVQPIVEQLLRGVFGKGYAPTMKASPLPGRLDRMRRDLETGGDTFERKLRYLFWLN
jgi:hypothetical protein